MESSVLFLREKPIEERGTLSMGLATMASVHTVAGRPSAPVSDRGKPTKFSEAAEWTGGSFDSVCPDDCARFRCPGGVCEDADGTVFLSDSYNHAIRIREPRSGSWSTLAGKPAEKGVAAGTGEAARFSFPQRIAADAGSGDVVVAGGGSHAIHRVTRDGVTTLLAGTTGAAGHVDGEADEAAFNRPIGLAIDVSHGVAFVGEAVGQVIRQITLRARQGQGGTVGSVLTLAGKYKEKGWVDGVGADARFDQPCGLVFLDDGEGRRGSLIIADCNNHCIRRMCLATLSVTTVAGKAGEAGWQDGCAESARFANPSDVALSRDQRHVIIADNGNHCVRQLTLSDGRVVTLCGTPGVDGFRDSCGSSVDESAATEGGAGERKQASFFFPQALATAEGGALVADTWNHSLRRLLVETGVKRGLESDAPRGEIGEDNANRKKAKTKSEGKEASHRGE